MEKEFMFVAVDFINDPKVSGYAYWYLCEFANAEEGDRVVAPLGSHNRLQEGIVRLIRFGDEFDAPFPLHSIKYIKEVKKAQNGNAE